MIFNNLIKFCLLCCAPLSFFIFTATGFYTFIPYLERIINIMPLCIKNCYNNYMKLEE